MYCWEIAEAITQSGQLSTRTAERVVNDIVSKFIGKEDAYVYYADTDSVGVNLQPLVDKYFSKLEYNDIALRLEQVILDKIQPALDKAFEGVSERLGCKKNFIFFKLEQISSRAIHTAKKRYAQLVVRSEGVQYAEPKVKIMGIEASRSSTPAPCRTLIKDGLKIMLTKDQAAIQYFIQDEFRDFCKLRPEEIAFPRGANNLQQYTDHNTIYTKGCPKHVRAALLYNHLLKKLNIDDRYEKIHSGEKIKFISLKMPNPIHENVIGFVDILPPEFKLEKYVDYDEQWTKAFLEPMTRLVGAAGWTVVEQNTLDDLFA